MRLLVVDDSSLDRALVAELAAMHGIEVREADDAASALKHVGSVDVVLLDGHIPGVDVADLASRLRRISTARIILWSGAPERVSRDVSTGVFDEVVAKPADLTTLEETFRSAVFLGA